jgi:hypothetical protein
MPELQFADGVLARLNAHGERSYDERAYLFVLAAIEQIQTTLPMRRHVSGQELALSCRDLALARFGHLVYAMVEVGLLSTQPGDTVEDFNEVFDFSTAFAQPSA